MNSYSSNNSSTRNAPTIPLTFREICIRAFVFATRGLGVLALFFALSFAQFINTFFFGIMVIFILIPGHIWTIIYPEGAEAEDIEIPNREYVTPKMIPRRCGTDEISDYDLNENNRLGWDDIESQEGTVTMHFEGFGGEFSGVADRQSEMGLRQELREREERNEHVGTWLDGVEELVRGSEAGKAMERRKDSETKDIEGQESVS